eukprot:TRINITY_DN59160_c0_g1_i1.p1 TRINITY_DN59160_c0_g1~~TRINITY_DN59160_c0_g1_i1.p1  ORF type:complete len:259 (+),score=45.63 TRINITY_DN59160_c0_g1_i1:52-828(+)
MGARCSCDKCQETDELSDFRKEDDGEKWPEELEVNGPTVAAMGAKADKLMRDMAASEAEFREAASKGTLEAGNMVELVDFDDSAMNGCIAEVLSVDYVRVRFGDGSIKSIPAKNIKATSRKNGLKEPASPGEDKEVRAKTVCVDEATQVDMRSLPQQVVTETYVRSPVDETIEEVDEVELRRQEISSASVGSFVSAHHKHCMEPATKSKSLSRLRKSSMNWSCNKCKKRSKDYPDMKRFRCEKGCDFDLCGDCMLEES